MVFPVPPTPVALESTWTAWASLEEEPRSSEEALVVPAGVVGGASLEDSVDSVEDPEVSEAEPETPESETASPAFGAEAEP
jgi:hypothetical protein